MQGHGMGGIGIKTQLCLGVNIPGMYFKKTFTHRTLFLKKASFFSMHLFSLKNGKWTSPYIYFLFITVYYLEQMIKFLIS